VRKTADKPLHLYAGTYEQIHAPLPEKNIYFNPLSASLLSCYFQDMHNIYSERKKLNKRCLNLSRLNKQYRCTGVITWYPYTDACNPIQVFTVTILYHALFFLNLITETVKNNLFVDHIFH